MSTKFPANLDDSSTFPATAGTDTPNSAGSGKGLSSYLNDLAAAIIAAQTKVGSAASTPSTGKLLRGTGAGTSAWQQLVMATDVAAFSSDDIRGVVSNETGTGALVFASSPTIVTPTIASFASANHNHSNSAGGGTLGSAAITGIDKSVTTTDSNPYKFSAYRNSAWNTASAAFTLVPYDTELFDTNSNFASSIYTVPVSGFYQFNWRVGDGGSTVTRWATRLQKNSASTNVEIARGGEGGAISATSVVASAGAWYGQLTAGDTAEVQLFASSAVAGDTGQSNVYFNGYLVNRT